MVLRTWMLLVFILTHHLYQGVRSLKSHEKVLYKNKVLEMFSHAFHSYMDHAYPADELMPLSCKGRVRGQDKSRGDIDDALGTFSLTLVDSLDTLAVLGRVDEFNSAIKTVIRDVSFDRDVVVSVFETNIRVLGGLLGAHFAAEALKASHPQLSWYSGHLLRKAEEIGRRLLPAFNTSTGLPFPKVNLRHGMGYKNNEKTTCTACAGTILLEFAALSRLTGDPEFEMKAHKAMEVLWQSRHQGHNLLGSVINVHNGEWTRKDSGVGAGSDSYYEYVLKSYILLGDAVYLKRFQMHYGAIKRYISNGPMLVDVSMNSPTRVTRSFMDSLLAFWPGLQVLWGDVDAAIHTHDMLYHVTEKHNFLPEAFTLDFRLHWSNHPLRPEFSESTYFLYQATRDPYYLDVGKTIVDNLNKYARVSCGFAAIKDLRNNEHEDRMDSFVLAETFKYLFLLFAEDEDVLLDLDDFVFSTEAHLFPLSLASANSTLNRVLRAAQLVMRSTPTLPVAAPPTTTSTNSTTTTTNQQATSPSFSDRHHMMQVAPNKLPTNKTPPTCKPSIPPPSSAEDKSVPYSSQSPLSPPPPVSHQPQTSPPSLPRETPFLTVKHVQCPNDRRPFVLQDQFEKLVLKQCTSSRFKIRPAINKLLKRTTLPRLDVHTLDFTNQGQVTILGELGIVVEPLGNGKVQVSHLMQKAKTPEDAEEGWYLMQDIMKLMTEQKKMQGESATMKHTTNLVQILVPTPPKGKTFEVGPALFGPVLGVDMMHVTAELDVKFDKDGSGMGNGCQVFSEEEAAQSKGKVVMVMRGGCLFVQKVRNAQEADAVAAIIADNVALSNDNMAASYDPTVSSKGALPFSMSGDGVEDVKIPSVFMRNPDALFLHDFLKKEGEVIVQLSNFGDVEANQTEEETEIESSLEDGEKVTQEEEREEVIEKGDLIVNNVNVLSKKVQHLLDGLDESIVTEELKDSVARELSKLKELQRLAESVVPERGGVDGTSGKDGVSVEEHRDGSSGGDDACPVASQSEGGGGP